MKTLLAACLGISIYLVSAVDLHALSCSGKIVSVEDPKSMVAAKCGEPAWKEESEEVLITRLDDGTERHTTVRFEEWTYNFGPDRLMQVLKFKNGVLVEIEAGGYGYVERPAGPECGGRVVSVGDTKAAVILKCGAPSNKDERSETVIEDIDEKTKRIYRVSIEEWTYNFGPDRFMKTFIFKNNRLVDIRLGGYGH